MSAVLVAFLLLGPILVVAIGCAFIVRALLDSARRRRRLAPPRMIVLTGGRRR